MHRLAESRLARQLSSNKFCPGKQACLTSTKIPRVFNQYAISRFDEQVAQQINRLLRTMVIAICSQSHCTPLLCVRYSASACRNAGRPSAWSDDSGKVPCRIFARRESAVDSRVGTENSSTSGWHGRNGRGPVNRTTVLFALPGRMVALTGLFGHPLLMQIRGDKKSPTSAATQDTLHQAVDRTPQSRCCARS